ncbi:hypothetical protein DIZ81_13970 [Legionella taurinensis]|uniref:Uncharacterized protein n=1 Tax=Legionella taurinensis TaxID=70611 RepID=A0AB38N6T2_9GAMM|nr:hypothetical protein [Legionella taurinensis]MDX1838858.1 hypothetical protein [Legionella taurinensis]PUT38552.1 hypothetical protein DB744_13980 [Legionella taurinensis]PUT39320.1 hypothetical protein DB746_14010 [Legionella taurinensis]PUT41044.1 hypothetical protein DB743_13990 [Legionella taurinensis]PUT44474.1 hypothetical protein DB745_14010 [Legionella taurinensis]
MIVGTTTWYCADGTISYFNPWSACNDFNTCPDASWKLSEDKSTCSRPNFSCLADPKDVSEIKLLAAIAYGEARTNNYEEIAAIANAIVRRRDSWDVSTINELVEKFPNLLKQPGSKMSDID